jgi:hypothetical protein
MNAGNTFQRKIDQVMAFAYLDDLMIFSESPEAH